MPKFKPEDFVWAKMKNYPPWPGKIMLEYSKEPPTRKKQFHYVYFFGYDNHNWVPEEHIYTYIDHVHEYSNGPMRKNQYFTAALNYIHEQYWCLVELKREPSSESGYPMDTDDEKELEEDDRKAGRNILKRRKERQCQKMKYCEAFKEQRICQRRSSERDTSNNSDFSYLVPYVNDSSNLPVFVEDQNGSLSIRYEGRDGETLAMLPNLFGVTHTIIPTPSENMCSRTVRPPCTDCKVKFGFIGLGKINRKLIPEFLSTKHTVNIWSKIPYKYDRYTNKGAIRNHTPEETVISSDVIFCTIPDVDASKHIAFAKAGLYDGFSKADGKRKLYISITNMNEKTDEEIRKAITKLGGVYFEVKIFVPLFDQRNNASPIILCSGDPIIYEEVKSYLRHLSAEVYHFGGRVDFSDLIANL